MLVARHVLIEILACPNRGCHANATLAQHQWGVPRHDAVYAEPHGSFPLYLSHEHDPLVIIPLIHALYGPELKLDITDQCKVFCILQVAPLVLFGIGLTEAIRAYNVVLIPMSVSDVEGQFDTP